MKKKDKIEERVCPHSMAFMLDNWVRRIIQRPRRIVGKYIKKGNRVIDLGCGPGFFTIDMAKMAGEMGEVIAIDLQKKMLDKVKKKAKKHQVDDRIKYHQSFEDSIGKKFKNQADFVMAYYMIHETNNPKNFLREIKSILKPGGLFLLVEPRMHVSEEKFKKLVRLTEECGYKAIDFPENKGGRGLLLSH